LIDGDFRSPSKRHRDAHHAPLANLPHSQILDHPMVINFSEVNVWLVKKCNGDPEIGTFCSTLIPALFPVLSQFRDYKYAGVSIDGATTQLRHFLNFDPADGSFRAPPFTFHFFEQSQINTESFVRPW
jgi:hypothetical protein